MTRVVRGGFVLVGVLVLMLGGLRKATAGPCKADGVVCRTSQSCCGTSGNNGVCIKASGAKFGTCCTPARCTGTDCGPTDDGCGGTLTCPCEVCNCYCANGTVIPDVSGCIAPTYCDYFICSDPGVGESCRIACIVFGSTRTGTLCAPCQ